MLPANATPESRSLFAYGIKLIDACPAALYDEAAISGSVARGRADAYSDCEIPLWMDTLQDASVYKAWMESVSSDATLMRESIEPGKAIYLEYIMEGVKVCTIWQTWDRLEEIFTALDANELPHDPSGPWMLTHLLPVGAAPRLHAYKTRVQIYPDDLRRGLIDKELKFWRWKMGVADIFLAEASAYRRSLVDLRRRQLTNFTSILNILLAYNRLWVPDRKWYNDSIEVMAHKPPALIATIDRLLTEADPAVLLPTMRALMLDTLRIIAGEFAVEDLIANLEQMRFMGL